MTGLPLRDLLCSIEGFVVYNYDIERVAFGESDYILGDDYSKRKVTCFS